MQEQVAAANMEVVGVGERRRGEKKRGERDGREKIKCIHTH